MNLYAKIMAMVFLLQSCNENEIQKPTRTVYPVLSPYVCDTAYNKEYVADIVAFQHVELRARVDGYLEKIHIDEGQFVKKGQILFTISNLEYIQELAKARAMKNSAIAEAKVAELEVKNTKMLADNSIVSKSQLEIEQSKLEALRNKIEEAKTLEATAELQLSFTEIKAPFDGVIDRLPYKTGSLIEEGTLLTTISDNRTIYAYFYVPEREYLRYLNRKENDVKQTVSLVLANDQVHNFTGVIETVEGTIDRSTGNIGFRASFANPDLILKHGASGKIRKVIDLQKATLIPQKSTFEIQENTCVFVMNQDSSVMIRKIKPKIRIGDLYVIESGLESTDKIVYEGFQNLSENIKIIPKKVLFQNIYHTPQK